MKKIILSIVMIIPFLGIGCTTASKARSIESLGDKGIRVEIDLAAKDATSLLGKRVSAYRSNCRTMFRRGTEATICTKEPLAEGTVIEAIPDRPTVVEFLGKADIDSNTEFELASGTR